MSDDGSVLFTGQDIKDGQNVWQSMGGQQVGTRLGPRRVRRARLVGRLAPSRGDLAARPLGPGRPRQGLTSQLTEEQQASLKARLKHELRVNTYDPKTGDLVVSPLRAEAIRSVAAHYTAIFFGDDPATEKLRDAYAIPVNAISDPERMRQLNDFFFWASWACSTNRPGGEITYTNNWPSEKLIDNRPSGAILVWSVISFVVLLAGIGALSWYFAVQHGKRDDEPRAAGRGPAAGVAADAFDAGDAEILLGRHGADRRPDRAGCV